MYLMHIFTLRVYNVYLLPWYIMYIYSLGIYCIFTPLVYNVYLLPWYIMYIYSLGI